MSRASNAAADIGRQSKADSLSDAEFCAIRGLIQEITGISMNDSKRQLICRRLGGRLEELGMSSFSEYIDYVRSGVPSEVEVFSNAVTTNLTSFFREDHHFEFLRNSILPELHDKKRSGSRRLRIWSAGSSTGEEPYSIAMTLLESMPDLANWDARILATDLDSDVLARCRRGQYSAQTVAKVPAPLLKKYFSSGADGSATVGNKLRGMIQFNQLNLMTEWPMRGKFDVIFCRNVIIYFDKPTQRVLVERYANILEEGGHLIIGHSESLLNVSDRFNLIGKTIYRKTS